MASAALGNRVKSAIFGSGVKSGVQNGGPSKLTLVLQHLNQEPKLQLHNVSNMRIQWNAKDNGFGARYFVKDALPRIRWANPSLEIDADKVYEKRVKQNIELTFSSGQRTTIAMDEKWSTDIIQEVMDSAGGEPWRAYKKQRKAEGLPVLPVGRNALQRMKSRVARAQREERAKAVQARKASIAKAATSKSKSTSS